MLRNTAQVVPASRRHILILDEQRDIAKAFVSLFEAMEGFAVHTSETARQARGLVGRHSIDLAIVDLTDFRDADARIQAIRAWRAEGYAFPLLATSARDYLGFSTEVLDAGADDFLRKPYLFSEMRARIRRQLERRPTSPHQPSCTAGVRLPQDEFTFAGARITPDLIVRFPNGHTATLTPKLAGMLHELHQHTGTLLLKSHLVHAVWGADANVNSASVNQYLHLLRKLFCAGGIDLRDHITPELKLGWRIGATAHTPQPPIRTAHAPATNHCRPG